MADVNYVSPAGMQPKVGWQPDGFLGGMLYADQQRDYKDVLSLSKLSSMYGLDKQRNELQEYGLNSTLRDAQRNEAINKANVGMDMFRPQQEATLGEILARTGQTVAQTEATNINNRTLPEANKLKNEEAALKNRGTKIQQLKELSDMAIAAGASGQSMDYVVQKAKELGVPEAIYRNIAADPAGYTKRVLQMDAQHQAALAKQELVNKGSLATANARTPQERSETSMINALAAEEKRKNPALTDIEARAAAIKAYWNMRTPAGLYTPGQKTLQQQEAERASSLRSMADAVAKRNPELASAYRTEADRIERTLQPQTNSAPPGTPTNPIVLK